MSTSLPHDLLGLVLMVFLLGLRHGMDPDHLATIDGLARYNAASQPRLARWSGCLFSLGHGAVVTLVAAYVALAFNESQLPAWLERLGEWISIAILLALGGLNVAAVLRAPAQSVVRPRGLKGRYLRGLTEAGHPAVIAIIGAAFAISFDTVGQTALFSAAGQRAAGLPFSIALGAVFTLGMMTTDLANGMWVARIVVRADARARLASRIVGLSIAALSIAIALLGMARLLSQSAGAALSGMELPIGLALALFVAASFVVAMRVARPRAT
jgi:nickel/cobalt transporter (NiCoT) family protein